MSALGEMAWVAGVVLAILAAVFGALGDNLIKLSYTKEDLAIERGEPPTKIWCRPLWYAGMTCLLVLNTACVIAALSISDASLTIPFGGLHICFNLGFATLINSEVISRRAVGFTMIIFLGLVLVLVSANHDTVSYTVDELKGLFGEVPFIVATTFLVLMIGLLIPAAFCQGDERLRCFASAALVGLFGTGTQVFVKTMAECFEQQINSPDSGTFDDFFPYIIIVVAAACATTQITLLNRALSLYNAFVVVPIVNSTLIVFGSLYAAILFKEYERFDLQAQIVVPIGIFTTGLGVALLAADHRPLTDDEGEDDDLLPDAGIALVRRGSFSHSRSPKRDSMGRRAQTFHASLDHSYVDLRPIQGSSLDDTEEGGEQQTQEDDQGTEEEEAEDHDEHDETLTLA